jgi:large subunit ribosomal protein L31
MNNRRTGSLGICRQTKDKVAMKKEIHPKYIETTVSCACGTVYQVKSLQKDAKVGICAHCHPFYTGKHKLIDTAGRIDRFKKRYATETKTETK